MHIKKGKVEMGFYQDRISELLKELGDSLACNFDKEQLESLNAPLRQFSLVLKNVTESKFLQFFNDDMKNFKAWAIREGKIRKDLPTEIKNWW